MNAKTVAIVIIIFNTHIFASVIFNFSPAMTKGTNYCFIHHLPNTATVPSSGGRAHTARGGQVKPLNAVQEQQAVIDRPLCGILTLLWDLHKVMAATLPESNYALMAFSSTLQKRHSCALFLIRISVLLTQAASSHLYSAERRVEVAG